MKIYLIPGLGYDHRIFERLDLKSFDTYYLDWIEPKEQENISNYAQRMTAVIKQEQEPIILIGHSLGGILAQEISTFLNIEKIILISSIKSRAELPLHFKILAPLNLHKFFSKELPIRTVKYWGKNHGFENKMDQELFKSMVGNQSNHYLQWALRQLSIWETPKVPSDTEILQIHGDQDKTFPIGLIQKPYTLIPNASHIVVYKQPDKVQEIIRDVLLS